MQSCIAKLQEIISRLKRNKSRKTSSRGGIAISIHQVNKHPKTEPRMFVLALRALKLVYRWITIKNFAVTEKGVHYTTIEGSYKYQGQTWLSKGTNQDLEPAYFSLPAIFRNKFLERIRYRSDKEVNQYMYFKNF